MFKPQASSKYELNKHIPYTLHIDDDLLHVTKQKLRLSRYPVELVDLAEDDWNQGAKAHINAEFTHFKVEVGIPSYGLQILHFAHQRFSRTDALPLLIAHGWPGSFLESRKIIQPLTEPSSSSAPAFHLIIPSIPGYGRGNAPEKSSFSPVMTARAFHRLMVDVLGYKRYLTHGGDWGAVITRSMAMQYPKHVHAQHLTFVPCAVPPWYENPLAMGRLILNSYLYSTADKKALDRLQYYLKEQSGYLGQQSTRPQSLGFGLGDSPIGLFCWLLEKYHEWMDVENYDMPANEFLAYVMMHWMQGATPGLRYYKAAYSEKDPSSVQKASTSYTNAPTGVSHSQWR